MAAFHREERSLRSRKDYNLAEINKRLATCLQNILKKAKVQQITIADRFNEHSSCVGLLRSLGAREHEFQTNKINQNVVDRLEVMLIRLAQFMETKQIQGSIEIQGLQLNGMQIQGFRGCAAQVLINPNKSADISNLYVTFSAEGAVEIYNAQAMTELIVDSMLQETQPTVVREEAQQTRLNKQRILVVDSDKSTWEDVKTLMTKAYGPDTVEVECYNNGVLAVAVYQKQPFDIVMIANNLPFMSGVEVITAIRESMAESESSCVIFDLAGNNDEMAANCDATLRKPFEIVDFAAKYETVFAQRDAALDILITSPTPRNKPEDGNDVATEKTYPATTAAPSTATPTEAVAMIAATSTTATTTETVTISATTTATLTEAAATTATTTQRVEQADDSDEHAVSAQALIAVAVVTGGDTGNRTREGKGRGNRVSPEAGEGDGKKRDGCCNIM